MSIMTVLGKIDASKLGVTLTHEHVFIDLSCLVEKPERATNKLFYQKIKLSNLRNIKKDPYAILDNTYYNNPNDAYFELKDYKNAGGTTLVDVTLDEIGRNPLALKKLSQKSGVQIVMGCGHYLGATHSQEVKNKTIDELAADILKDINDGVDGVKAGVIGEIGTSAVISESEQKNVIAAGIAAKQSGLGVHIHTSLYEENGIEVADTLLNQKVLPNKICINHVDIAMREDYFLRLLDKGVMIEFDNFGKEFYVPKRDFGNIRGRFATDIERVITLKKLIDKGYEKQILISNDICIKNMFARYGGNGFAHIINTAAPMMLEFGVSQSSIDVILKSNPAVFLDRGEEYEQN